MRKLEKDSVHDIDRDKISRKRRVKRIKVMIVSLFTIIILIPIALCIGLMMRLNKIEKRLDILAEFYSLEEYDQDALDNPRNASIAYAAEADEENMREADREELGEWPDEESCQVTENIRLELEELDRNTEEKKVYLTFDDGPGKYTDELLDILAENNVKATFFVIAKTDEHSLNMYRRMVNEGHTLALHSYSHQYKKIYESVEAFSDDINRLSDLLYEATGERPRFYRFPGGSSNTVSKVPIKKYIKYLNENHLTYFDWNVVNGDATGKLLTSEQMVANVMDGVGRFPSSIVLMHDTVSKDSTVRSLPVLIQELKEEGYIILPITKHTKTVQHIKADSVK